MNRGRIGVMPLILISLLTPLSAQSVFLVELTNSTRKKGYIHCYLGPEWKGTNTFNKKKVPYCQRIICNITFPDGSYRGGLKYHILEEDMVRRYGPLTAYDYTKKWMGADFVRFKKCLHGYSPDSNSSMLD